MSPGSGPSALDPARSCGTCHACCIWLGIEAPAVIGKRPIRKHTGQVCKHLDVATPGGHCSVYGRRPAACQSYWCGWRTGFLGPDDSPERVGFIITVYNGEITDYAMTVMIFDVERAGDLADQQSPIYRILREAQLHGIDDVRLVNFHAKTVLHFLKGEIFTGHLLPTRTPESLDFTHDGHRIGTYQLQEASVDD